MTLNRRFKKFAWNKRLFIGIAILAASIGFADDPIKKKNCIAEDYIVKPDKTIKFDLLTDQLMTELGMEGWAQFDPGFPKWFVTFEEIPGDPPYKIQTKRIAQENPNVFEDNEKAIEPSKILKAKKIGIPVHFVISSRGYLPGEHVMLRLSSNDKNVFREITVCPNPLVVRKNSGEILLKATLKNRPFELTSYDLDISGIREDEYYKIISSSGHEKLRHVLKGPIFMNYMPGVVGSKGGISKIAFQMEDGSSYGLEIPWGSEFSRYLKGEK